MSAIRYSAARRISATLGLENRCYWSAFSVLTECDGLALALSLPQFEFEGTSFESCYFVLNHVARRTLAFNKTFECVRIKEIIDGRPQHAISGCKLSESSVKRALQVLSAGGFLVRLKLKGAVTPIYGLNLPLFLKLLRVWWKAKLDKEEVDKDPHEFKPNLKPSNLMLRGWYLLQLLDEYLTVWKSAFDYLQGQVDTPIEDADTFIEELSSHLPSSGEMRDAVSEFEEGFADSRKIRKLRKRYLEEVTGCEQEDD